MMKNESGFSLVELMAALTIFGILCGTAVVGVSSALDKQRTKLYTDDAIRLASSMDYKMRSDNKVIVPKNNCCLVFSLDVLGNDSLEKGPYGKEYDKNRSFVVAKRRIGVADVPEEYEYYVRIVEKMENNSYRGIDLIEYNKLFEKSYVADIKNFTDSDAPIVSDATITKSYLSGKGISCVDLKVGG